jgi:ribosomal protein L37AE/L43A
VRKNPKPRHTCSSARTSKVVKNATKFWICDKVKVNISAMFARNMVIAGGIARMVILMT